MDNVKGQRIHVGDNLLVSQTRVETQVELQFTENCLMPKSPKFPCDSLRTILVKKIMLEIISGFVTCLSPVILCNKESTKFRTLSRGLMRQKS